MLEIRNHLLADLFYPAGMQSTPHLLDLAFPSELVEAARRHYLRTFAPAFPAPSAHGAGGDSIWHFAEDGRTVMVARLGRSMMGLTQDEREDVIDSLMDQVDDMARRSFLLRAFVCAVEAGLSATDVADTIAYANAAGR